MSCVCLSRQAIQLWDLMEKDFDDEVSMEEILMYKGDLTGSDLPHAHASIDSSPTLD